MKKLSLTLLLSVLLLLVINTPTVAQNNTNGDTQSNSITSILEDSSVGLRMSGMHANGRFGYAVNHIGDVNNDGFDDISVCAPFSTFGTMVETGEIYVIFGSDSGFGSTFDVGQLDGSNGFRIRGQYVEDRLGYGGANALGDINNDGIDDMIVTTPYSDLYTDNINTGSAAVIFGRTDGFASVIHLDTLGGDSGFLLYGTVNFYDNFGTTGGYAGDMNGDDIDDFFVTADDADPNGESSGAVYVIYGKHHFPDTLNVDTLYLNDGFLINGEAFNDNLGVSAGSLKDINGDGINDFAVGAFHANQSRGAGYVVFGRNSIFEDTINTLELDGTNGFKLLGEVFGDRTGRDIGDAGDLNADGINDMYISAHHAGFNGIEHTGKTYIIYGSNASFPSAISLGNISANQGFVIGDVQSGGFSGNSVAGVGDINGDQIDDLLIGALFSSSDGLPKNGAAYLLYGRAEGFPREFALSSMTTTDGYSIVGDDAYARLGFQVNSGGDFNGDGANDFMIGADYGSGNTPGASGEAYVIYGIALDTDGDSIADINDDCPNQYGECDGGCPCLHLNLKVMLEGPFDISTSRMRNDLNRGKRLLPGQSTTNPFLPSTSAGQPYHIAPWNYAGNEGANFTNSDYEQGVVDWMLVSLRRDIYKSDQVAQIAAVVYKDGTLYTKTNYTVRPQIADSLYVVLEHRNHMGVMSPHLLPIVDGEIQYDFRQQDSYKRPGGIGQKNLGMNLWVMSAGDIDQASDIQSYDINANDNAAWMMRNGIFGIYHPADVNMDGDINALDNILRQQNNGFSSRVPK